jgi:parallel beta-helix repeat protein
MIKRKEKKMIKKLGITVLIFVIILASFNIFLPFESHVEASKMIYVGGTGAGNYSSIQIAIDNATSGDTIFIYSGIYNEKLIINKTVNLIGENRDGVVITGISNFPVIYLNSSNVTISNLTLRDGKYGISMESCSNITITQNSIINNSLGILVKKIANSTFSNNNVMDNHNYGMHIEKSSNNSFFDNHIYLNRGYGLYLKNSWNNSIYDNNVSSNDYGIYLGDNSNNNTIIKNIFYDHFRQHIWITTSGYNIIQENNISYDGVGIRIREFAHHNNVSSNTINNVKYAGIDVTLDSDFNEIFDNKVTWSGNGLLLDSTKNSKVESNYFYKSIHGIEIRNSMFAVITNNDVVSRSADGISLEKSHENIIMNNNLSFNRRYGVYIYNSTGNSIINNEVSNNMMRGIYTRISSGNKIENNNVNNNAEYGITVESSINEIIKNNEMINCGLYLTGDEIGHWTDNFIPESNTVNGKPIYFWYNKTSGSIPKNAGQVILYNCMNIVLEGLDVSNGTVGVELAYSSNNIISNNEVQYNSLAGIISIGSNVNIFENNQISFNKNDGVQFMDSNNNVITNSSITNSVNGIWLKNSNNNEIIDSHIKFNSWLSIHFFESDRNLLVRNTFAYNKYGPYLRDSDYNRAYHNNIKSNTYGPVEINSKSYWNYSYPTGGNYWDMYNKMDIYSGPSQNEVGPDGFGDKPFSSGLDNPDKYPLMLPFGQSIPSAPRNLNGTSGDSFVNLIWSSPDLDDEYKLTGYKIYRASKYDIFYVIAEVGDILFYNDTTLTNGLTYSYKIGAVCEGREGFLSEEFRATPYSVPSAPYNLKTETGLDHINLTWRWPLDYGGSQIKGYKIYKGFYPGSVSFLTDVNGGLKYKDTEVSRGKTYYYQVSAFNDIGESTKSEEVSVYFPDVPDAPSNLTVKAGDSYIELRWKPPLFDGGYSISHYIINRSSGQEIYTLKILVIDKFFYNDTEVDNGKTYNYTLKALNKVGPGPSSNKVNATPTEWSSPIPRANIVFTDFNGTVPKTVSFKGIAFDNDGIIISYHWNFGDGNISFERDPIHTFQTSGKFNVSLIVTDNDLNKATAMITINILPKPVLDDPDSEKTNGNASVSKESPNVALGISLVIIIVLIAFLIIFYLRILRKPRRQEGEGLEKSDIVKEQEKSIKNYAEPYPKRSTVIGEITEEPAQDPKNHDVFRILPEQFQVQPDLEQKLISPQQNRKYPLLPEKSMESEQESRKDLSKRPGRKYKE